MEEIGSQCKEQEICFLPHDAAAPVATEGNTAGTEVVGTAAATAVVLGQWAACSVGWQRLETTGATQIAAFRFLQWPELPGGVQRAVGTKPLGHQVTAVYANRIGLIPFVCA